MEQTDTSNRCQTNITRLWKWQRRRIAHTLTRIAHQPTSNRHVVLKIFTSFAVEQKKKKPQHSINKMYHDVLFVWCFRMESHKNDFFECARYCLFAGYQWRKEKDKASDESKYFHRISEWSVQLVVSLHRFDVDNIVVGVFKQIYCN